MSLTTWQASRTKKRLILGGIKSEENEMKRILLLIFLVGCKDPVSKSFTDNPEVPVELMFTHDGCRVYRFWDDGYKYFTNCFEAIWDESCGKNCRRVVSNKTTKISH